MQKDSRHEIIAFLIIAATAFLFICLLTHDPRDTLESGSTVHNACGPAGAFVSFKILIWIGKIGAYGITAMLCSAGVALLFRHRIHEWKWKVVGAVLMILALASFEVAGSQGSLFSDTLPGGYYGQFVYGALLSQLSTTGTILLLGLVVLVAFIISTDTVFYPAIVRAREVVLDGERWRVVAKGIQRRLVAVSLPTLPRIARPRLSISWKKEKKACEPEKVPREKAVRASTKETTEMTAAPAPLPKKAETQTTPPRADPRPPLKIREAEVRSHTPRRKPEVTQSGPYRLPSLDLLDSPPPPVNPLDRTILEQTAAKIEETLKHFKIDARVVEVQKGPTITQYEVSLAAGIKVHKILNLSDDLAMALKAPSIRIVAPIPGKSTVGVEVPNKARNMVGLRGLIESPEFRDKDYKLPLALGKDVGGCPVIGDLGDMPHLLIAGSTGSGKSVCINSIIVNLLLTRSPDEVKLILVDPKMVELAPFENIPHLLTPVVTDMKKAPSVLNWMVEKMEERYELLALTGVRHITGYNSLGGEKIRERIKGKVEESEIANFPETLPFMVVIIDELADLMMTSSKEVEASITRLSQKSRAVGIHVILATQRPSVDVITGLIKANMPSRVSFHVASRVDSRTILDRNGAEKLLGKGDLLYLPPGTSALRRVQGTFISDKEIRDVVKDVVKQAAPQFSPELSQFGIENAQAGAAVDELYEAAVKIVLGSQRGSVTLLQRQLQIGYTRASRLMEIMYEHGLVGPFKGSKAREVYYTLEEWDAANAKQQAASASGTCELEAEDESGVEESEEEEEAEEEEAEEEEAGEEEEEEAEEEEEEEAEEEEEEEAEEEEEEEVEEEEAKEEEEEEAEEEEVDEKTSALNPEH
jgi:S-DNA-T family DNA segregation ATPase FtsK/SpoIIIE